MKEPKKAIDNALLQQARDGDREARSALYEATYQEVWRTVRSLIRSEDDALDVLQDTYVRAFTRLDQLKNPASVGPWLRTIAANTARSHLQKTKPLLFSDLGEDAGEVPEPPVTDTAALPEASLDQKETAALLRELLDSLSDGQRLVLSLHYYEDMPVREIARSLDVTESTVKTQLRDGRKRLEQKVRDLERRGVNLYGLSALPLFRTLMQKNAETLTPPLAASGRVQAAAAEAAGSSVPVKAVAAGSGLGRRILLGLGGLAVLGGIALGSWLLLRGAQKGSSTPTGPSQPALESSVPADSLDPSNEDGPAPVADSDQFPTNLATLTARFGNEAVARSVIALYGQPSTHFSLDVTNDYETLENLFFISLILLNVDGEVQYEPFALRDVTELKSGSWLSPKPYSLDESLSAFGTGEMSCLYYTGSTERKYDPSQKPTVKSGLILREPNMDFYKKYFPGGDFCNQMNYRPSSTGNAYTVFATQLHAVLTCILTGGTDYAETGTGEINGRAAVCYTGRYQGDALGWLTEALYYPVSALNKPDLDPVRQGVEIRFWIDVATGLPLRVEADLTTLERELWAIPSLRDLLIRQEISKPGILVSFEDAVAMADTFLVIHEASFRLDLEPQSQRIQLPVELPEESERRILVNDWKLTEQDYAQLREPASYELLSLNDEALSGYTSASFQALCASEDPAAVIPAEKNPGPETKLYLALRQNEASAVLLEAGQPVCRCGEAAVGTYVTKTKTISYLGKAMPADFESAVTEAVEAAAGTAVDFTYDGAPYHGEKVNKLEWTISGNSGVEYTGDPLGADFEAALSGAEADGAAWFELEDRVFARGPEVAGAHGWYTAETAGAPVLAATKLSFFWVDPAGKTEALRKAALTAAAEEEMTFEAEGDAFTLAPAEDGWSVLAADGTELGRLLMLRAGRTGSEDDLSLEMVLALLGGIREMENTGATEHLLELRIPEFAQPDPDFPERPVLETTRVRIITSTDSSGTYYNVTAEQYLFQIGVEEPAYGED